MLSHAKEEILHTGMVISRTISHENDLKTEISHAISPFKHAISHTFMRYPVMVLLHAILHAISRNAILKAISQTGDIAFNIAYNIATCDIAIPDLRYRIQVVCDIVIMSM